MSQGYDHLVTEAEVKVDVARWVTALVNVNGGISGLARALGVQRPAVYAWKSGKCLPDAVNGTNLEELYALHFPNSPEAQDVARRHEFLAELLGKPSN